MCVNRVSFCCMCTLRIRTLSTVTCRFVDSCERRFVYSKSFELCESCDYPKKPQKVLRVPRVWLEKKFNGVWFSVTGFTRDSEGKITVLTRKLSKVTLRQVIIIEGSIYSRIC